MITASTSTSNEPKLKLRPDIQIAKMGDEGVVLVGEGSSHALRLRGASSHLIDPLKSGCTRNEICGHLQNMGYSPAEVDAAVDSFLLCLSSAGMLQPEPGTSAQPGGSTDRRWNIDPLARVLAAPFASLPWFLNVSLGSLALAAALSLMAVTAMKGRLIPCLADFSPRSCWGVAGMVPWLFLHELSHATACRMVGCRVSGLGMRLRKWGMLVFVDTRYLALSPSRWAKVWVSLAGPFWDVLFLGLVCLMILACAANPGVSSALRLLFLSVATGLFLNLNPWRVSDGSNVVSALVDDPFLLKNALPFKAKGKNGPTYFCYRLWAFSYLGISLVGIGYSIRLAYSGLKQLLY